MKMKRATLPFLSFIVFVLIFFAGFNEIVHAWEIYRDPYQGGHADGPVSIAQFYFPSDVAIDKAGNLYVIDSNNHCVRKITPTGKVSTLAGDGDRVEGRYFADGPGRHARFSFPSGITIDAAGNLYVADS